MKKKQKRKPTIRKPLTTKSEISIVSIAFLILSLLLTYIIVLKGLEYNKKLFTWSFIALFLGLLFESYFIFDKLNSILNCFSISFFVSLITFLPAKRERIYNLQNHIELWPYFFLISFIIGVIIVKQKEVTTKQTEGTTLLQTMAFLYWLTGFNLFEDFNLFKAILLVLTALATLFSIANALTKINLGKTNRLFLSIWSSFILVCLAIDNVFRVFSNGDIDQQNSLILSVQIAIQYFFVGISSVYVVQNIFMLFAFLPEKNTKYKQTLYVAKKMHLDRYSDLQVAMTDSIFCICFCTFLYFLNNHYNFIPRHTIIWIAIVTFPLVLQLLKLRRKKNYS